MGSVLIAQCVCGYRTDELDVGSGMIYSNKELFPAICSHCKNVIVANYLDKTPKCPACKKKVIFYNDNKAISDDKVNDETDDIFSWSMLDGRELRLPDIHYLCPKCGKYTIKFQHVGCWD